MKYMLNAFFSTIRLIIAVAVTAMIAGMAAQASQYPIVNVLLTCMVILVGAVVCAFVIYYYSVVRTRIDFEEDVRHLHNVSRASKTVPWEGQL